MPAVTIVDVGGGNLGALRAAFGRLGVDAVISGDPDEIGRAERLVLPGVGAAATAMDRLHCLDLVEPLRRTTRPLLGVCLGMQLLFEDLDEGNCRGLGLIPGRVARLAPGPGRRVPHMGWSRLTAQADSPLLKGIADDAWFYFVHSYAAPPGRHTLAACRDHDFCAVAGRDHYFGAQFHPERSSAAGRQLLDNFVRL